ncbi:MAG TPA: TIR domain-containing protein [Mycobacteriales bacterium]|nr:TIR domain-containing protein [Mycobacteriales bacterium]
MTAPKLTVGGIFLNYRGNDALRSLVVSALHARLIQHFGEDRVFMDVQMEPGVRYPDEIRDHLCDSDVLLAIVHEGWLDEVDHDGVRLIDRERDWVREEIKYALGQGKDVFQVLLGEAKRPAPESLPADIRELAHRQDHRLRSYEDVEPLVLALEQYVAPSWSEPGPASIESPSRRRRAVGTALVALLWAPLVLWRYGVGSGSSTDRLGTFLVKLVFWGIAAFVGLLVVGAGLYVFRRRIHTSETAPMLDKPVALRLLNPIAVAWVFGLLLLVWSETRGSLWPTPTYLGFVTMLAYGVARTVVNQREREKQADRAWPIWTSGVSLKAALLHADLDRLRSRLEAWGRPLSREQRDKALWAVGQLDEAAAELKRRANQTRRDFFMYCEVPDLVMLAIGAVGLAAMPGLAVLAVIHSASLKGALILVLLALALTAMGGCGVELRHRYERWQSGQLAVEVEAEIAYSKKLLTVRSRAPAVSERV